MHRLRILSTLCAVAAMGGVALRITTSSRVHARSTVTVTPATAHDVSGPLNAVHAAATNDGNASDNPADPDRAHRVMAVEPNESGHAAEAAGLPVITTPPGSEAVEQTTFGTKPPATLVASFDGLGVGFTGPQGIANLRNPSDNTLAVGPNHIVQIVNTRMAIFTKKGAQYDTTGLVLYGPGETRNVFKGFGGGCEATTTVTPSCGTTSSQTAGSSSCRSSAGCPLGRMRRRQARTGTRLRRACADNPGNPVPQPGSTSRRHRRPTAREQERSALPASDHRPIRGCTPCATR